MEFAYPLKSGDGELIQVAIQLVLPKEQITVDEYNRFIRAFEKIRKKWEKAMQPAITKFNPSARIRMELQFWQR